MEDFAESSQAYFIGTGKPADNRFSPRILVNDNEKTADVLSVLESELKDCALFDFAVAFVASSDIQALIEILNMLESRGVKGCNLSSIYLSFDNPAAQKIA